MATNKTRCTDCLGKKKRSTINSCRGKSWIAMVDCRRCGGTGLIDKKWIPDTKDLSSESKDDAN